MEKAASQRPLAERVPPHVYFVTSAVFHYLGPAFAVRLFASVAPLGVAWLRIASAALVFAVWRRPWGALQGLSRPERWAVAGLGAVLALMNSCFYLAIALLPLSTVGAIEFLGPIALAAYGARTRRNVLALTVAAGGVAILTDVRFAGVPVGYLFAFANCGLFALYIVLGHRISGAGGIDRLAISMLVATIVAFPIGIEQAVPALLDPRLLAAGIGVGLSSSVIPYVTDQLAMARLPRASFALLLSILPATATAIGFFVLRQAPTLPGAVRDRPRDRRHRAAPARMPPSGAGRSTRVRGRYVGPALRTASAGSRCSLGPSAPLGPDEALGVAGEVAKAARRPR